MVGENHDVVLLLKTEGACLFVGINIRQCCGWKFLFRKQILRRRIFQPRDVLRAQWAIGDVLIDLNADDILKDCFIASGQVVFHPDFEEH